MVEDDASGTGSERPPERDGLSRRRDAVLAAVAACGVFAASWWVAGRHGEVAGGHGEETAAGSAVAELLTALAFLARPVPLAVGVAGAFTLELAFARFPETGRRLWSQRRVRFAGTALVAVVVPGGAVVAAIAGVAWLVPTTLAVLAGGLCGYAVLLVAITSGVVPSPETWF
jgi:hypothetical protein